jgi:hypothetical protein
MENDEIIIFEKTTTIQPDDIHEDGSCCLFEQLITREKQMKVWVNSNEICGHSRPHVHASYDHQEYEISIDDSIEVLKAGGPARFGRFLVKSYSSPYWIQTFRKAWNGIMSNYKFVEVDGMLLTSNK